MIWSERPLRIEEAVDYLAVDPGSEPGFDEKNRMPVPKEIVRLCSSLVVIVEVSQPKRVYSQMDVVEYPIPTTHEIRLSHFSVKEYFTSGRLDKR